jgi:hypothetical protein
VPGTVAADGAGRAEGGQEMLVQFGGASGCEAATACQVWRPLDMCQPVVTYVIFGGEYLKQVVGKLAGCARSESARALIAIH